MDGAHRFAHCPAGVVLATLMRMRTALLVAALGVFAVSLVGCGDASTSTGSVRRGYTPAPNDDPSDDPNAAPDPDSEPNPNSDSKPTAPATPGTSTGQLAVTVSNAAPATDLGTTLDLTVTIEPKQGATGSAVMSVTGLPPGVTAVFNPASVTLGTAPVTSKMTITVPYEVAPTAPGQQSALVIKAAAGAIEATANANFKVNPKVTLTIPVNSAALIAAGGGAKNVDGWGGPAFGTAPKPLQTQLGNNITFVVRNADSTARTVHGQNGFAHGDGPVAPGAIENKTRAYPPGLTASGYLHGEPNNVGTVAGFTVRIVQAQ